MKDTSSRKESKVPLSAQPALTKAEALFARILLAMATAGAIPKDQAAKVIAYLHDQAQGRRG